MKLFSPELNPQAKPLILTVDDDPAIRLLLQKILGSAYTVEPKQDVAAAFAWLAEGNMPDLIICDINLPGMNGSQFLANIRRSGLYRDVPMIMLSSMTHAEAGKEILAQGARAYLEKPFDPVSLLATVSQVFAAS
jgi:two-component system, chemotaxis family, chemotaxis protein CheY